MALILALYLALLTPQATSPAPPSRSDYPAIQSAPQPSSDLSIPMTPSTLSAGGTALRKIGGAILPPKVIYQVEPEFSREARKSKISGMTLVNLIVDTNGNPQNVHVARSMASSVDKKHRKAALTLDDKAVEAVKQYRFNPATEGGKPVPVELNVEVNFQIF